MMGIVIDRREAGSRDRVSVSACAKYCAAWKRVRSLASCPRRDGKIFQEITMPHSQLFPYSKCLFSKAATIVEA